MAWIEMDSTESATNAVAVIHNSSLFAMVGSRGVCVICSLESFFVYLMQPMGISD